MRGEAQGMSRDPRNLGMVLKQHQVDFVLIIHSLLMDFEIIEISWNKGPEYPENNTFPIFREP